MKIYGTKKTKEEIERELRKILRSKSTVFDEITLRRQYFLEQLLQDFTVLPEEKDWYCLNGEKTAYLISSYPQGVIINQNQ